MKNEIIIKKDRCWKVIGLMRRHCTDIGTYSREIVLQKTLNKIVYAVLYMARTSQSWSRQTDTC